MACSANATARPCSRCIAAGAAAAATAPAPLPRSPYQRATDCCRLLVPPPAAAGRRSTAAPTAPARPSSAAGRSRLGRSASTGAQGKGPWIPVPWDCSHPCVVLANQCRASPCRLFATDAAGNQLGDCAPKPAFSADAIPAELLPELSCVWNSYAGEFEASTAWCPTAAAAAAVPMPAHPLQPHCQMPSAALPHRPHATAAALPAAHPAPQSPTTMRPCGHPCGLRIARQAPAQGWRRRRGLTRRCSCGAGTTPT